MAQSLSDFLHKLTWKVAYYYALALGLVPAPLNLISGKIQPSKCYLIYSAMIQCTILILGQLTTALLANHKEQKEMYMHARLILHGSYIMGRIARVLIIAVLCLDTWTKRQNFIKVIENFKINIIAFIKRMTCLTKCKMKLKK